MPDLVRSCLEKLKAAVPTGVDMKRSADGYDLIKHNYRRLLVGNWGGVKDTSPRLYRCFYNPLWSEDIFGMHAVFRTMVRVRNLLLGEDEKFAMSSASRGVWTASRVHHYPSGGGFLARHQDLGAANAAATAGLSRCINMILLMSQYGVDFSAGGGFVELNGRKFPLDENFQAGDLIIYDETNFHGVSDIDPLEPLDLSSPRGRYAAFVTLFVD